MAKFTKSTIPTVEYIEDLALEAAKNPEKLKELGALAEKLGRRANQNLRALEKAKYKSEAYKHAQSKLGTDKPRYSQARAAKAETPGASAAILAENAIQASTFLRMKTSTVGGVREKARPGFNKLVQKAVDEYQKRSGEYDKEKARQSKAISKYTKRQKKLEKDMTKFFNSNAFDELKALGSDIIDATFEALESGLNIDELLKAFEKYEIGDLSEDVGLLTLWDEWVSQDLAKRLKEEKEQEDD